VLHGFLQTTEQKVDCKGVHFANFGKVKHNKTIVPVYVPLHRKEKGSPLLTSECSRQLFNSHCVRSNSHFKVPPLVVCANITEFHLPSAIAPTAALYRLNALSIALQNPHQFGFGIADSAHQDVHSVTEESLEIRPIPTALAHAW
jgi:hypothetical protein